MKITFLGTGTSHGVPSIDCMLGNFAQCPKGVCGLSSIDPKHARTRSSILVEYGGRHVLVDVSSDFRQQALRERIPKLDAVLITHCHADHIGGVPDIRSYTTRRENPLDFYGSPESMAGIRSSFPYIFDPNAFWGGGIPRIALNPISGPFMLFEKKVFPLPVEHGGLAGCLGFRIGGLAYIPDLKSPRFPAQEVLAGLDILIVNCLRETKEHASHLVLDQSMKLAREIGPRRCRFIHMSHDIHYQLDGKKLDDWMEFAYDGMTVEV
ncbi:MAG TPA: MBL fold metallo-hydrolase [Chitinivibrionales bacterium]|nr:MBL fold metallo-hydrolase [Chitinivibrionales bacterium]